MMAWGPLRAGFQHFDQGNAERGGLTGPRLGLADDVVAIEGRGDQFRLDRRRSKVADLLESPKHGRAQTHGLKPVGRVLHCTLNQTNLPK